MRVSNPREGRSGHRVSRGLTLQFACVPLDQTSKWGHFPLMDNEMEALDASVTTQTEREGEGEDPGCSPLREPVTPPTVLSRMTFYLGE